MDAVDNQENQRVWIKWAKSCSSPPDIFAWRTSLSSLFRMSIWQMDTKSIASLTQDFLFETFPNISENDTRQCVWEPTWWGQRGGMNTASPGLCAIRQGRKPYVCSISALISFVKKQFCWRKLWASWPSGHGETSPWDRETLYIDSIAHSGYMCHSAEQSSSLSRVSFMMSFFPLAAAPW